MLSNSIDKSIPHPENRHTLSKECQLMSAGKRFREALSVEKPLQIIGTINAYAALLAKEAGYRAIYLSGAGVANASLGVPDLGITTLQDVLEDARRITAAVDLPLLVDIDTGFGSAFNIARTIREMIQAGVAGVHLEDQVIAKRCGHRPGKKLVTSIEMVDRIKAAVDARYDQNFIIMARTDALASEELEAAAERIKDYIHAGADMIFLEGARELKQYQIISQQFYIPILANITEFGVTPLFTVDELATAGVSLILYPLSAFRAASAAMLNTYQIIRSEGTQKNLLSTMQTREDLYKTLHYYSYEKKLDELFLKEQNHG